MWHKFNDWVVLSDTTKQNVKIEKVFVKKLLANFSKFQQISCFKAQRDE